MKAMTGNEILRWFQENNETELANFINDSTFALEIETPQDKRELMWLTYNIAYNNDDANDVLDNPYYLGSLFWITEYDIFAGEQDKLGFTFLNRFRRSFEIHSEIETEPGFLFHKDEYHEQAALIALMLLSEWNAVFKPFNENILYYFMHERFIEIIINQRELYDKLYERFNDWNPKRIDNLSFIHLTPPMTAE